MNCGTCGRDIRPEHMQTHGVMHAFVYGDEAAWATGEHMPWCDTKHSEERSCAGHMTPPAPEVKENVVRRD